jgi:hypothetical protein
MGGERRRRRLRRTGRSPAADPTADPTPESRVTEDLEPDLDTGDEITADPQPTAIAAPPEPATIAPPLKPATAPPVPGPPPEPTAEKRRREPRGRGPRPGMPWVQHRPSPADLAELPGPFALTAGVQDPEPPADQHVQHSDDTNGERGLRGLVGGGSSQVNVAAAMRARDASRPGDQHLAAAEADLPIVRRGWVPRDELPRAGH